MRIIISNELTIENAPDTLYVWAAQNLTFPNPDYAKKIKMGLWTGNTPKELRMYEINGDNLILPFGVIRNVFPLIRGGEIVTDFAEPRTVNFNGHPVPLYDYQERAVAELFKSKYGILQAPAGSGKTQIGIELMKRLSAKTLWLTHTADLLKQSRERAERYIEPYLIGTITEGKVEIGAGVTFATVQTMAHLDLTKYKYEWRTIIVDEVHRVCTSANGLAMFEKILSHLSAPNKYGLTATVHRSDGMIKATKALVGDVVSEIPAEAVADKIMPVTIFPYGTNCPLPDQALNPDGTLNFTRMISALAEDETRNALIAECVTQNWKHSCLILSDRLSQLDAIMGMLPSDLQALAVKIDGGMTSKKAKREREEAIEQMRTGQKRFLFATYSLAKEGLDIPRLDRLFMATPVKDYAVVVQSIGRIARVSPEKETPIAYDFVDNFHYAKIAYKQRLRHYRKANAIIKED